jgi:hypothetical protein
LNGDGFTGVCILAQNKENSWNDWDKDLKFTKKKSQSISKLGFF